MIVQGRCIYGGRFLMLCCLIFVMTIKTGFGNHDLPSDTTSKRIIGWLELVHIYPGRLAIRAKMDTGAKSASLNATGLTEFDRNGEKWVRFTVDDKSGLSVALFPMVILTMTIERASIVWEEMGPSEALTAASGCSLLRIDPSWLYRRGPGARQGQGTHDP